MDSATIQARVADYFHLDPWIMQSAGPGSRTLRFSTARQIAMYLCRELTEESYPAIGRAFHRDHSTVIAACQKCEKRIEGSGAFADQIEAIRLYVTKTK